MKVKFFALIAILIIVIAGFVVYLNVSKNKATQDNESTEHITTLPTAAPFPKATPTPAVITEKSTDLYPAYQIIDDNIMYGYISSTGEFSIKPSFDTAYDYHDGIAIANMDDQYLALDSTGSIISLSDNFIGDFHNGAAIISRYSGKETVYGYIDTEGTEIIRPQYKLASNFGKEETAYVYSGNGKYSLIDKTGKVLGSYEQDEKYEPTGIQDGYVIYYVSSSNTYGVVDSKGEVIIKPSFVEITYLGDGLFAVKDSDEDSFGGMVATPTALLNNKGEAVTDFSLYDVSTFHNGYASATDGTYTYFIGTDGKEATELPKFEGRGTLTLYGDVIKAELDGDLFYYKKDKTLIWQNATTQTLSGDIVAKQIKFKPNKYVVVKYPQIEGLADTTIQVKINTELKSLFTDSRSGLKESDDLSVDDSFHASLIKNLLIIQRDGYDYYFGAAHGNPIMDYFYIDITTGTFYKLKDLFIEGSDYVAKINEFIKAEITVQSKSEESMYFPESFTGISENQHFIIKENSLTIYFYPYDIAAYAAGFPQFEIPFEDIYDYLNFNGAFWGSFK